MRWFAAPVLCLWLLIGCGGDGVGTVPSTAAPATSTTTTATVATTTTTVVPTTTTTVAPTTTTTTTTTTVVPTTTTTVAPTTTTTTTTTTVATTSTTTSTTTTTTTTTVATTTTTTLPSRLVLRNLLMGSFGPFDEATSTSGDFLFVWDDAYPALALSEFGRDYQHTSGVVRSPGFEFRVPGDTLVYIPVDGVVERLRFQPTSDYLPVVTRDGDDWEVGFRPTVDGEWGVEIDHVVSLDCPRPRSTDEVCELPLRVDGEVLMVGSSVRAGQVLGYVGNVSDWGGTGLDGRTELGVTEYPGHPLAVQHCPVLLLADGVRDTVVTAIGTFLDDFEAWAGDDSVYDQGSMVVPGCLYSRGEFDVRDRDIPGEWIR